MLTPPRLAFLGLGRIGRARLQALVEAGAAIPVALVDPDPACLAAALQIAPHARPLPDLEAILGDAHALDGLVIATPSAGHAAEAVAALEAGLAVFCQKPLGRSADEVRTMLAAARRRDRLLGADFSYAHAPAVHALAQALPGLGTLRAIELVFHNGWGPDRPWFFDPSQSGGGCLADLGIHLLDLLVRFTQGRTLVPSSCHLFDGDAAAGPEACENYALAELVADDGGPPLVARLQCSWNQPIGLDCDFRITLHGTSGALALWNRNGSYHDLEAEWQGRGRHETLCAAGDGWAAAATLAWAGRLAQANCHNPESEVYLLSAVLLDALYACGRVKQAGRLLASA